MAATIIDGKELARALQDDLSRRAKALTTAPRLVAVAVGHDEATLSYTSSQARLATRLGMRHQLITAPEATTAEELDNILAGAARDADVDGIMLQTPLPRHLDVHRAREVIPVEKDVEAVSIMAAGLLMTNRQRAAPCTAVAALHCLLAAARSVRGMNVTVVGRSDVVGRPLGLLLLHHDATLTMTHSKTRDLKAALQGADAIVACAGSPGLIRGEMIRPGAIVVDVGTNSVLKDGVRTLEGDVNFDEAVEVASAITPVPGGVGPVTVTMLMRNLLALAEARRPGTTIA